jgi:hypothetical protein
MEYLGNHTKNEFKKHLKHISFSDLQKEAQNIDLELIKGRTKMGMIQNPYGDSQTPLDQRSKMKMLRYQKALVIQKLLSMAQNA